MYLETQVPKSDNKYYVQDMFQINSCFSFKIYPSTSIKKYQQFNKLYTTAVSVNTYFKMDTGHEYRYNVPIEIHHKLNQSPIFKWSIYLLQYLQRILVHLVSHKIMLYGGHFLIST